MSGVLLESRPFRPFKSSEEYLYAMKEDLAEWLLTLYPHLRINVDNFMDRLETGVALCEHANAVKAQAYEYVQKKQAKKMTSSVAFAHAHTLIQIVDVRYFPTAKAGTFFARDNVSNFIHWCRQSLKIIECLLFETDDLIMRKNEKHVILCLLEVARRGAKFGMLAPMLIQMERQIDREIAADQRKQKTTGVDCLTNDEESDSETDDDQQPVLMYGPLPQIITNDLKSLDEMVRDLVAKCTCPTQFPMIRVSEGKYRIGDTKVLIFVRILRNHVMVRVGGGWDTLAHYLDKHDPCRCRTQHRTTQGARLINKPGAVDLQGAQVYYDRSPPQNLTQAQGLTTPVSHLGPPTHALNRSRSRSPSHAIEARRSISPNPHRRAVSLATPRGRSPSPSHLSPAHSIKTTNGKVQKRSISPSQLPVATWGKKDKNGREGDNLTDHSDNVSEVSDEGYRSLGVVQTDKVKNRTSLYSQNSVEDIEENEQIDENDKDKTNEAGLRRTQFSQIYLDETKLKQKSRSSSRERSETLTPPPIRSRKSPSPAPSPKTNRKSVNGTPTKSTNQGRSTWNGRSKGARPSLGPDIFQPHSPPSMRLNRHAPGRRSVSAASFDRRGSVTTPTSPTQGRLREELLRAVRSHRDDVTIAEHVRKLLKKYGSLNVLDDDDDDDEKESTPYASPRKDSKRANLISRIPAPISHRV